MSFITKWLTDTFSKWTCIGFVLSKTAYLPLPHEIIPCNVLKTIEDSRRCSTNNLDHFYEKNVSNNLHCHVVHFKLFYSLGSLFPNNVLGRYGLAINATNYSVLFSKYCIKTLPKKCRYIQATSSIVINFRIFQLLLCLKSF